MENIDRLQVFEIINGLTIALIALGLIFNLAVLLYIGLALLITGLLIKPLARFIAFVWKKLTTFIGMVISRIVLATVYYLVLTPVALVVRVFRSDPLMLDSEGRETYFREKNKSFSPEDFEKIW